MTVANSAERSLVNFCRAMTSAAGRGDHQGVEGENRENRYQFVNIYTYVIHVYYVTVYVCLCIVVI